jgi:hypothetical protein
MKNLQEDQLEPEVIDLGIARRGELDETLLRRFGSIVKHVLDRMFGDRYGKTVKVRGTQREIDAFLDTIGGEKRYMDSYVRYGLDDPKTLSSRHRLDKSVRGFEKETGLKWPIK